MAFKSFPILTYDCLGKTETKLIKYSCVVLCPSDSYIDLPAQCGHKDTMRHLCTFTHIIWSCLSKIIIIYLGAISPKIKNFKIICPIKTAS